MTEPLCLNGWTITHLINLQGSWQANITDNEYVAVATGKTINEAVKNAEAKADNEIYVGRLAWLANSFDEPKKSESNNLLERIGLAKPVVIDRRI